MIWYKITRYFYFVFGLGFWTNWGHFSISWKLNFSTFDKFAVHFPQVRWENSFSAIQSPIYCPFFWFIWSSFTASFKRKFSVSKTPFTVIFSNGLGQFGSVNRAKKKTCPILPPFLCWFSTASRRFQTKLKGWKFESRFGFFWSISNVFHLRLLNVGQQR